MRSCLAFGMESQIAEICINLVVHYTEFKLFKYIELATQIPGSLHGFIITKLK